MYYPLPGGSVSFTIEQNNLGFIYLISQADAAAAQRQEEAIQAEQQRHQTERERKARQEMEDTNRVLAGQNAAAEKLARELEIQPATADTVANAQQPDADKVANRLQILLNAVKNGRIKEELAGHPGREAAMTKERALKEQAATEKAAARENAANARKQRARDKAAAKKNPRMQQQVRDAKLAAQVQAETAPSARVALEDEPSADVHIYQDEVLPVDLTFNAQLALTSVAMAFVLGIGFMMMCAKSGRDTSKNK